MIPLNHILKFRESLGPVSAWTFQEFGAPNNQRKALTMPSIPCSLELEASFVSAVAGYLKNPASAETRPKASDSL